jgi:hypothetical protein
LSIGCPYKCSSILCPHNIVVVCFGVPRSGPLQGRAHEWITPDGAQRSGSPEIVGGAAGALGTHQIKDRSRSGRAMGNRLAYIMLSAERKRGYPQGTMHNVQSVYHGLKRAKEGGNPRLQRRRPADSPGRAWKRPGTHVEGPGERLGGPGGRIGGFVTEGSKGLILLARSLPGGGWDACGKAWETADRRARGKSLEKRYVEGRGSRPWGKSLGDFKFFCLLKSRPG